MQYIYLKTKDNAEGNLDTSISAVTLTIPLEAGNGANFPAIYRGTTTSGGTNVTLNKTGIGASGIAVGDAIENITDGSHAFVTVVNTNSLTTTELQGGSSNLWNNGDTYASGRFVITANSRDPDTGAITASEMMLVDNRSTDILTINASGRGYNGSTAQTFQAGDYVDVFVVAAITKEISKAFGEIYGLIDVVYTKTEVDSLLALRSWKDPVVVATTANGTLATAYANGQTVDGVVLATGDRILLKDQSSGADNGIYIVAASGAPTRASDFDATAEVYGSAIQVKKGTSNADTVWMCTTDNPTIGSTSLSFAQIGASLTKASTGEAQVGSEDTHFMTPSKTNDAILALARPIDDRTSDLTANSTNYRKMWMRSDSATPTLKCILKYQAGVWAASANLSRSKGDVAAFGIQTDAVIAGGTLDASVAYSSVTEKYNGTSWSTSGNLAASKDGSGGAGASSSAGIIFGGFNQSAVASLSITEAYNGTSWSAGGNMSQQKFFIGGCGTSAAALTSGGRLTDGTAMNSRTESYNGTSWSTGGNMSQTKFGIGLVGTSSAGFAIGGTTANAAPPNAGISNTETYNGTSWSAGTAMPDSRCIMSAGGLQAACFAAGGIAALNSTITISFDGVSWTTQGNSAISLARGGVSGVQALAQKSGGGFQSATGTPVSNTETFTYGDTYIAKTITVT